ncbi:ABC transporter permease [Oceaniglobus roseus]|uniref:ABC transporter permease n=1 Tax=Oceaniglobus roseus TaxID=1737570 RepID=UPI001FE27920|nr:ABC transporter permease subunit [Kandeliimicrobium roseum]
MWELAALALDGRYILAGPVGIAGYMAGHAGLLGRALWATFQSALLGYLCGNLAAVALAALALLLPVSERAVRLFSLAVFCLPLIATGPILRVLYGPGIGPQVTLSALGVFYTTLVPLLAGLRAAPQVWLDLVDSYGRGRWAALRHVRGMAAVPYLVAGLQIAAPAAFLGAMIGEFTGAERGVGVLALRAMRSLDVEATWALAALAAAVSILAYEGAGRLGRLLWPGAPPVLLVAPVVERRRAPWVTFALWLALAAAVLLVWHGTMELFGLNAFFAKRPGDVWAFLVTGAGAAEHREVLFAALGQTLAMAGPGYVAGLAAGAVLAALCVLAPRAAGAVLPVAVTLRAVPIVTTAPLIVLALGRGAAGVVTIVAVMIFFPTLIACLHGLRLVPRPVIDVFETYAAGRWRTLVHARLPAALPAFFASARMTVPAAILAATVAEWLATGTGIGNLMALSSSTSDYNMLWSAVAVLTLVAVLAHGAVALAERAVFARYAPEQLRR